MNNRYVRVALIIAALALGLAVVAMFAGFDGVRIEQSGSPQKG